MCKVKNKMVYSTLLIISFQSFSAFASSPEEILGFDIESIKIGSKLNEVTTFFKNDNRWENVAVPEAKKGRISRYSASGRINTDKGASCSLKIDFARPERPQFKKRKDRKAYLKKMKKIVPNPLVYKINMQCTYNPAIDYSKHLAEITRRFGNPDYISEASDYNLSQVYVGTDNYSPYAGYDDLTKKCAEIIREHGKAGTNSKALSMARRVFSSMLPFKDIALIKNKKKHPILDSCPEISKDYLALLNELYSPLFVYKASGNEERGINSTNMTLIQPTKSGQPRLRAELNKRGLIVFSETKTPTKSSEMDTQSSVSESNFTKVDAPLKTLLKSMRCDYKEEDIISLKKILQNK